MNFYELIFAGAEGEEYVLEEEGDTSSQNPEENVQQGESTYLEGQSFMPMGDTDVTVAIASFLQEDYDPDVESETQHEQMDHSNISAANVVMAEDDIIAQPIVVPLIVEEPLTIPTAFDETIERVIRWEDCTDISARPTVQKSIKSASEEEEVPIPTGSNLSEVQDDHNNGKKLLL